MQGRQREGFVPLEDHSLHRRDPSLKTSRCFVALSSGSGKIAMGFRWITRKRRGYATIIVLSFFRDRMHRSKFTLLKATIKRRERPPVCVQRASESFKCGLYAVLAIGPVVVLTHLHKMIGHRSRFTHATAGWLGLDQINYCTLCRK